VNLLCVLKNGALEFLIFFIDTVEFATVYDPGPILGGNLFLVVFSWKRSTVEPKN
jgi:hypothetical protein